VDHEPVAIDEIIRDERLDELAAPDHEDGGLEWGLELTELTTK
jgi:hypothetical protein